MFVYIPHDQSGWVSALSAVQVPVLQHGVAEIARLGANEEGLVARDISRVLLRDPLFTVRVLRFLQQRRGARQSAELTTVEHALMMLGVRPFFEHFSDLPAVEVVLAEHPLALDGLMRVISRAHNAALYARDWAGLRHDIESDEVVIAAMLHDLAEMMIWCYAPQPALRIQEIQLRERSLRSSSAQQSVLGFTLESLQLALVAEWKLPARLQSLMHDTQTKTPRVLNVLLAVDLARHSANGWDDPALPDDYTAIQKLLKLPRAQVLERIRRTALHAENPADWYHMQAVPVPEDLDNPLAGIQDYPATDDS